MGTSCGTNRTIAFPAFSVGQVVEVYRQESKIKVTCHRGLFKLEFPVETSLLNRVQKGDPAYCLNTPEAKILTLPKTISSLPLKGKVTRSKPAFYEFTSEDGKMHVFPSDQMKTSFEIHNKPVPCVVEQGSGEVVLRVSSYSPFTYYQVNSETAGEKRVICRHRQLLSEIDEALTARKAGNAQVKSISKAYSGFRKVRRDGNTLYRSVFILYLEHLCRKSTPIQEVDDFIDKVQSKAGCFALLSGYQEYAERLSAMLSKLREIKSRKANEELVTLQWMLQDRTTDKAMINYFRMMIANYVASHYQAPRLKRFVVNEIKDVVKGILNYGTEADGLVKYAIPDLLSVVLLQQDVSVDTNEVFETIYAPVGVGRYPCLSICKTSGNSYHMLYSIEENTIDGYDFKENSYRLTDLSKEEETDLVPKLYSEVVPSALHAIQT